MRTIAVINLKGGVGKTTTAINLGAVLASCRKKVLLIDADPQANLTSFFGIQGDVNTLADLLKNEAPGGDVEDYILPTSREGISVLPASLDLADCDIAAARGAGNIRILRDFCRAVEEDGETDFAIIDCPPGFTAASVSALYAADDVIIPTTIDRNSIDGTREIIKQINGARNINPRVRAFVLISILGSTETDKAGAEMLRKSSLPVLYTAIHRSKLVSEAMFDRKTLPEFSPRCKPCKDYNSLVIEMAAENGWRAIGNG